MPHYTPLSLAQIHYDIHKAAKQRKEDERPVTDAEIKRIVASQPPLTGTSIKTPITTPKVGPTRGSAVRKVEKSGVAKALPQRTSQTSIAPDASAKPAARGTVTEKQPVASHENSTTTTASATAAAAAATEAAAWRAAIHDAGLVADPAVDSPVGNVTDYAADTGANVSLIARSAAQMDPYATFPEDDAPVPVCSARKSCIIC